MPIREKGEKLSLLLGFDNAVCAGNLLFKIKPKHVNSTWDSGKTYFFCS